MKKKRAVIIALNVRGYYSLAIHYLKLYTEKDPYLKRRCSIFTAEYDISIVEVSILKNLEKLQADLICFSCYLWNIEMVLSLSKKIKALLPDSRIVLGGQEVTNSCIDYLDLYPFLDIIVDGEGLIPFKGIIYAMVEDNFESLHKIKGIQFRNQGTIRINDPSETIECLDDIPSPYLHNTINIPNNTPIGVMIDHVQGCPNQCSFCFESMRCRKTKAFSLDRIKEELSWAKSKGFDFYHILDPILCLNSKRRLEGMKSVINDVFKDHQVRFSVEIYAEKINQNNCEYLDCYTIFDIGLQSISPVTNKNIKRNLDIEKFLTGYELLKKFGKITNVYLIYGLPGDDYDGFMNSISFVESLNPSNIFLNKLCVLNGTPLRHDADKFAICFERYPPYEILSNMSYSYNDIIKSESFSRVFMNYYRQKSD